MSKKARFLPLAIGLQFLPDQLVGTNACRQLDFKAHPGQRRVSQGREKPRHARVGNVLSVHGFLLPLAIGGLKAQP